MMPRTYSTESINPTTPGPTRDQLIHEYILEPTRAQLHLVFAQAAEAWRHGRVEPLAPLEKASIAGDLVADLLLEFEMMGSR
jgi:hypothetical protein